VADAANESQFASIVPAAAQCAALRLPSDSSVRGASGSWRVRQRPDGQTGHCRFPAKEGRWCVRSLTRCPG
jgi:hypothetical protein